MSNLSRRQFLLGVSMAAVTAAIPVTAAQPVFDLATKSDVLAFAVGTPGAFDGDAIFASSPEEALRIWWEEWRPDDTLPRDPEQYVTRVPEWDAIKRTVSPADWCRAGFGFICERCGDEEHGDTGLITASGEAICSYCVTFGDRCLVDDPDDLVDDLVNWIEVHGDDGTREYLELKGWWDVLPKQAWDEARRFIAEESAT